MVVVSAKVEAELNGMPPEEAAEWLDMLGVAAGEGGGLAALIRASYKTLGLQTYFTTGGPLGCGELCARVTWWCLSQRGLNTRNTPVMLGLHLPPPPLACGIVADHR